MSELQLMIDALEADLAEAKRKADELLDVSRTAGENANRASNRAANIELALDALRTLRDQPEKEPSYL